MELNLNKLTAVEREIFLELLARAGGSSSVAGGGPPTASGEGKVDPPASSGHSLNPQLPEDPEREWGEAPPPNPPQVQRLPTPEQWVAKQLGNLQAVGEQNYRVGITRPKKDPIAAGIEAQGRYEAQMRNPEVLARRVQQLRKTNMNEWARVAEELGAGRLVQGVTARRFKVERFVGAYHPLLEQHLRRIDALPAVTDPDRERKMIENLRGLKQLKGRAS